MNAIGPPGPRPSTTRRGRALLARGALAAATAAAASGAVPASTDAPAPGPPPARAYTCERTYTGAKGKGWGYEACVASPGLPRRGRVDGVFLIRSRVPADPAFRCAESTEENFPSGEAELPDRVVGFHCAPDTA